jgi:nicotinate-nucleotide adenylyltransferase
MTRAETHKKRKIGILGGTFNPIHLGHLLTAQDALEQLGLERVIFIPSATPPHKVVDKLATGRDRLRMIKLAIRGNDQFEVDDIEIKRGGKSYSVDTLTALRQRNPRADLYFIIGADSLRELHLWREVARLVTLCTFVTVPRPGFEPKPVIDPRLDAATRRQLRQDVLRGHACDIASRDIRARVSGERSIRYLVTDAVRLYIARRRLYCARAS